MIDVLVAGAGPAGMIAAILLARAGKQVVLLDRVDYYQHKIGESVPGMINGVLTQLGLQPLDDIHTPIHGAMTLWGDDRRQQDFINEPQGCGWRLNRNAFEQQLYYQVQDAGITFISGYITQLEKVEQGWMVSCDHGDVIEAAFIIDATGRNAMVAKSQGIKRTNSSPLIAVWGIGAEADSHQYTSRTMIESASNGWWYGCFLPDNRPICAFHTSQQYTAVVKKDVTKWQAQLAQTELIREFIDLSAFERVSLTANDARSSKLAQCYGEHWAACGDAAISFDPLSSQGIFNGIATANMLVKSLLANNMKSYEQKISQIYATYQQRRYSLYQQAVDFYHNEFWQQQLCID